MSLRFEYFLRGRIENDGDAAVRFQSCPRKLLFNQIQIFTVRIGFPVHLTETIRIVDRLLFAAAPRTTIEIVRPRKGSKRMIETVDVVELSRPTGKRFLRLESEESFLESESVLLRHDVVENRVDRRGNVIKNSGDVIHPLVNSLVVLEVIRVEVKKSLSVKRCPTEKKGHHYRSCERKRVKRLFKKIRRLFPVI